MAERSPDSGRDLPLIHLVPNVLTIIAICAGLTAIRFGYLGDYETAVRLVLLAAVLDGLDGRLARLLRCQSSVGAELDSLADFLNFGIAPALILHAWTLHDFRGAGWIAVLAYVVCCVLRLARFNVSSKEGGSGPKSDFFEGVPSPAGALLAMLPMYVSFAFTDMPQAPAPLIALYVFIVGLLMISRVPTYSFKNMSVPRGKARYLMLGAALVLSAVLTYLWVTLVLIAIVYVVSLLIAVRSARRSPS